MSNLPHLRSSSWGARVGFLLLFYLCHNGRDVFLYLCDLSCCLTWPLLLRRVNGKLQPNLLNIIIEISSDITEETVFIPSDDFKTNLTGKFILESKFER